MDRPARQNPYGHESVIMVNGCDLIEEDRVGTIPVGSRDNEVAVVDHKTSTYFSWGAEGTLTAIGDRQFAASSARAPCCTEEE